MSRYVYVVEEGLYSNRSVVGVYDSPEAAMAHHPITPEARKYFPNAQWKPSSVAEPGQGWSNGCDWDDHATIWRYLVQSVEPQ